MDATHGFAKALVSASDDTILGFTALGPRTGELLPVVQLAMSAGLPYMSLADLIVTHPTMCEGLVSLFSAVHRELDGRRVTPLDIVILIPETIVFLDY